MLSSISVFPGSSQEIATARWASQWHRYRVTSVEVDTMLTNIIPARWRKERNNWIFREDSKQMK